MSARHIFLTKAIIEDLEIISAEQDYLFQSLCTDMRLMGGYLCLADPKTGAPFQSILFGSLADDKVEECLQLLVKQARLLARCADVLSSRHLAEISLPFAAAIRAKDISIIVAAGPNSELCESFVLSVGHLLTILDKEESLAIALQSHNLHFTEMAIDNLD